MINKYKMMCTILFLCMLLSACGSGVGKADFEEPSSSETTEIQMPVASDSLEEDDKSSDSDILEIGEKMFLTQINDIYFNFDDYKDKTIVVEGIYALFYSWDGNETTPVVYRNGPGCCGNDGWGGFLLKYDGNFPNENDWIGHGRILYRFISKCQFHRSENRTGRRVCGTMINYNIIIE